jgi:hypothetical protein
MTDIDLPRRAGDRSRWLVPAVSFTAAVVALAGAWIRPVWHDELYTLALVRLPVAELLSALAADSGPPLHYLLCHMLFVLVGWAEGSVLGTVLVRLPSVVAFALLPWVVWRAQPIDIRQFPWGPLLLVSWLPLLYFGTEARAYAVLALVNAVLWIRGPDWIERGGRWIWIFAALAACLPLLHYTGAASLLLLPALALFVTRARRRALLVALMGSVLPSVAWAPIVLRAPQASMAWLPTVAGPGRPGSASIAVLAPAGPFPALFEVSTTPVPPWLSVMVFAVLVVGAWIGLISFRGRHMADNELMKIAARLAIGLAPAVLLGVAALAGVPLYFAGRTETLVWAIAASLVAILITGLPPVARRCAGGSYVVIGLVTIAMWLASLPARPPAVGVEVGQALAPMVEDGDRVVVVGLWQLEVRHGLARGAHEGSVGSTRIAEVETLPRSQTDHPGWLDRKAATSSDLLGEATALAERVAAERGQIWLVWSPALPLDGNVFPAFDGWQRAPVAGSPIITVDLLVPPAAEVRDAAGEGGGS